MHTHPLRAGLLTVLGVLFAGVMPAFASAPQFSDGKQISTETPYQSAQHISDVFSNKSVYGKLQGTTPVDIYSFVPDRDGSQTIDLMERKQPDVAGVSYAEPVLILADPTSDTESASINLPSPGDAYHFALLSQISSRSYTEPVLLQRYAVTQEQTLNLRKGQTYYFVVVPATSTGPVNPYVIKFGTGASWTASDFVKHFSGWFRLQTGSYAASSPFVFSTSTAGMIILLLALAALVGLLIVQETYSLLANKSKSAGYLLIKMQPYSRIMIWVSLLLLVVGAAILFGQLGWVGIPFVLGLIFLPILINMLYLTFGLSRQVETLEVTKKEATIPFALRKRWFFSSLVSLFSFGAFLTYLAIYLAAK